MERVTTSASRGLLVAAAFLLAACRGDRVDSPPAAIRLIELSEGIGVEWPRLSVQVPADLAKPAELGALPRPARLARVLMFEGETGRDYRVALLAPTGTRYRFRIALPAGEPVLQLGLGYMLPAPTSDLAVRFQVRVTAPAGEPFTLLDELVAVRQKGVWLDREIPLEQWADKTIDLELETRGAPEKLPVWAAWSAPEVVVAPSVPEEGWNVLLVVLDTLRPDHLGCYGYHRPTSPNIDAFAGRGIRFETAISQSSWTRPAHRALFSGLYPRSRGGLKSPPLAQVLWQAGYRTVAITGGAQLSFRFGFSRGFEIHQIQRWVRSVEQVVRRLEANRGRKNFLFLHTYEIHEPYEHTEMAEGLAPGRIGKRFKRAHWISLRKSMTAAEKKYIKALYDGGIRYTDEQLGTLFRQLAAHRLLDQTIIILTSDHGEQFWEHGAWGHGQNMFDHQTRIPLIIHLPPELSREMGQDPEGGRVVAQQVRLVDLYPTILDLLGIPLSHEVHGRSLRPLLVGRSLPPRDAFSEQTYMGSLEVKALRSPPYKYVYAFPKRSQGTSADEKGKFALYDLVNDPTEQKDLAPDLPRVLAQMAARLDEIRRGESGEKLEDDVPPEMDPELRRQLESLGYLDN